MLFDSQKMPLVVRGSSLKLTVELADYYATNKDKSICEEIELSHVEFKAQAYFNFALDSNITLVDGARLGTLIIEDGVVKPHKMTLIKVIV